MKDMVTLGRTGITVNKNGFGALPVQRVSKEEAIVLYIRHMRWCEIHLIRQEPTAIVRKSLGRLLMG